MEEQNFQYFAFISYSHKDMEFAEKLQKRLESYKLPSIIRKENPFVPQNIRPIFRDKTDFNATKVSEGLHKELELSKFLIVICSPYSASASTNKHWVNDEVQHFINLGRQEYIIPIIVDGSPNAENPEEECFCPALKSILNDEFLGIDAKVIQKKSVIEKIKARLDIADENDVQETAFIKVVSRILGLKFNTLWQRHKRAERKKFIKQFSIVASLFVFLITGGLFTYFRYFHEYHKYFVDYVEKWGIPEGIHELTKKEISSRNRHWDFMYRGGLLRTVTYANSAGTACALDSFEHLDRSPILEFYYSEEDRKYNLHYVIHKSEVGAEIITYEYGKDINIVNFINKNGNLISIQSNFTSMADSIKIMQGGGNINYSNITSKKFERNKDGIITKEFFYRNAFAKNPISNTDGVASIEYDLDDKGRIIRKCFFKIEKKDETLIYVPKILETGESFVDYKYDTKDNLIKLIFYNDNGKVTNTHLGYAQVVNYFDNGNLLQRVYYDENEKQGRTNNSCSKMCFLYDNHGYLIKQFRLGLNDELIEDNNGIASVVFQNDIKGRIIQKVFENKNGKRCQPNNLKYAVEKIKNNEAGNMIEVSYFDIDMKPCFNMAGVATVKIEYDEYGRETEASFFGVDNKRCLSSYGYATYKYEYSEKETDFTKQIRTITRSFYGVNGEPILNKSGYFKQVDEWYGENEQGSISFFGLDDKLCFVDRYGYAKIQSYFNYDYIGIIETAIFFDEKGNVLKKRVEKITF